MKDKVLLIDDSMTIHRVVDLSIDLDKYDIVKVFSEEAAVDELRRQKFDFILLDNKLENVNLGDYVKHLKNGQPQSVIILLVGAFDKFDPKDVRKVGAHDFLMKPFDPHSLNSKLVKHDDGTSNKVEPQPAEKIEPRVIQPVPQPVPQPAPPVVPPQVVAPQVVAPQPIPVATPQQEAPQNHAYEPEHFYKPGNTSPFHDSNDNNENNVNDSEEMDFDPEAQFAELTSSSHEPEVEGGAFGVPTIDSYRNQAPVVQAAPIIQPEPVVTHTTPVAPPKPESHAPTATPNVTSTPNQKSTEGNIQKQAPQPDLHINTVNIAPTHGVKEKSEENVLAEHQTFSTNNATKTGSSNMQENTAAQTPPTANNVANHQDEDFYQLDEDAIFNKPAGQISESEILSISAPEQQKEEKPIAQKFEEEVLSIDEPAEGEFIFDEAPREQNFQATNVHETPPAKHEEKPIAQKFEEEILSIDEPQDSDPAFSFRDEPSDDFSQPDNNQQADESTDTNEADMLKILNDDFMTMESPSMANDEPFTSNDADSAFESSNTGADSFLPESSFFEDIPSPTAPDNNTFDDDALFKDEGITKDFADDIFPHDDEVVDFAPNKGNGDLFGDAGSNEKPAEEFDFSNNGMVIDDAPISNVKQDVEIDTFSFEDDDDILKKPEPVTKVVPQMEKPTPHASVSKIHDPLLDDSLDLDKLLEMDLTDSIDVIPAKPMPVTPRAERRPSINDIQQDKRIEQVASKVYETFEDQISEQISEKIVAKSVGEDLFSKLDSIAPKITAKDESSFDLIKMDSTPATNDQKNSGDNVFSGITVTIGRDEIMKMLGNAIDKTFLEKAVKEVLTQNMREIVRAVVPAIAEKFIKEEIEKLKDEG